MKSFTVMSFCDHSSSVYLDPTSIGTVRQPAIVRKYSMLRESVQYGSVQKFQKVKSNSAYFPVPPWMLCEGQPVVSYSLYNHWLLRIQEI